MKKNIPKNPWTAEDEREHFPSILEWWCAIAFFKTHEEKKKWSVKASFAQWIEKTKKPGSIINMTLFDQESKKHIFYLSKDETKKLKSSKTKLEVGYDDSYIRGFYPHYDMSFHDVKNKIKLDIKYDAESLPRWIAQDVTDGWLPMGLGFYRYGFIPKCHLSGQMIIDDKIYTLDGKGYFEHVWGNFSYSSPLLNLRQLKKTISVYSRLVAWWMQNHKLQIPTSIKFSTENNPLGYDWAWALLDNGWMIYYGNILFWIMQGPTTGTLLLSKDGKHYTDFGNVHFKYNKIEYSKQHDFYYPTELEVLATQEAERLHLTFTMTAETREYVSRFTGGTYWLCFVICEAPGTITGSYHDGKHTTNLSGICKIEPQRQVSITGHNSLKIDFMKPPKGVGISFDLDSHYLKKKISTSIQLVPVPKIRWHLQRIKSEKIHQNIKKS